MTKLFAAALLAMVPAFAGTISYNVFVNTSTIAPAADQEIELQFIPGGGVMGPAMAQAIINGFQGEGGTTLGAVLPPFFGTPSGSLDTTLTLDNSEAQDFRQAATFGTGFRFMLTLDGPAVLPPGGGDAGTLFSLFLFSDGDYRLGNPNVFSLSINQDGTITQDPSNTPGVFSITEVQAVPEPSVFWLAGGGLALLGIMHRRRPHQR